jgi:hypothetical protein
MSVKKIITGLALSMLLNSGAANADWGDVYYCKMTYFGDLMEGGKMSNHDLRKFKFKLDQAKNAMVLVSEDGMTFGTFGADVLELNKELYWPSKEMWEASKNALMVNFTNGNFMYSWTSATMVRTISADCDKF